MILLIDNYDSFTYNIAQGLGSMGRELAVCRADTIDTSDVEKMNPSAIVISPGPGRPENAGNSCSIIEKFAGAIPILGVCLGHQCIAHVYGAKIVHASTLIHGKVSQIFHDGGSIFSGVRNPFDGTRYHSLIVSEETVAAPLEVSAFTAQGDVMGIRAQDLMLEGVQFHPESIATPQGLMIMRNFLDQYVGIPQAA